MAAQALAEDGQDGGLTLPTADIRVRDVTVTDDELAGALMDGRTITVPLAWYPRLVMATPAPRRHWEIAGAGYGIHWPDIDEDVSTEGLLQGRPAPRGSEDWRAAPMAKA